MSSRGTLEDLLLSLQSVGDNLVAMYRRARLSLADNILALRFKIQTAIMEALWSVLGLSRFLLPLFKFAILVWMIFLAAIGLYYALYQYYVPKLLIEEPVYFNFDHQYPLAKLNLLMPTDHSGDIISPAHYGKPLPKKFLRPGSLYDFSLKFSVAKSPRNQQIGKFMVYMNISSKADELVAASARPVVVPYHSSISLAVDQLVRMPYYFIGIPETEMLEIHMMRNFKEPNGGNVATKFINISISRSDVDILDCTLTIFPEMSFFTYSLLHFPYMSFSIGVLICFWGLFISVMFYIVVHFTVKFISTVTAEEDSRAAVPASGRHAGSTGSGWGSMFDPLSSSQSGDVTQSPLQQTFLHRPSRITGESGETSLIAYNGSNSIFSGARNQEESSILESDEVMIPRRSDIRNYHEDDSEEPEQGLRGDREAIDEDGTPVEDESSPITPNGESSIRRRRNIMHFSEAK